jgi:hypothetical protein
MILFQYVVPSSPRRRGSINRGRPTQSFHRMDSHLRGNDLAFFCSYSSVAPPALKQVEIIGQGLGHAACRFAEGEFVLI